MRTRLTKVRSGDDVWWVRRLQRSCASPALGVPASRDERDQKGGYRKHSGIRDEKHSPSGSPAALATLLRNGIFDTTDRFPVFSLNIGVDFDGLAPTVQAIGTIFSRSRYPVLLARRNIVKV